MDEKWNQFIESNGGEERVKLALKGFLDKEEGFQELLKRANIADNVDIAVLRAQLQRNNILPKGIILFYSILFYSILFYSLFYSLFSILFAFYSILFNSIRLLFYSHTSILSAFFYSILANLPGNLIFGPSC